MSKKNILVVLLLGVVLLVSGCSSSSSDTKSSGISSDTFNGGDRALTMEFAEGTPPEKVRDQGLQPFTVRLLIENEGEFDISQGEASVALAGINPEDFNIDDSSQSLQFLRGIKKQGSNVIDGGRAQITFSDLRYLLELPSGTNTQTLHANLCYPYQTKSLVSLCISGDTFVNYDEESSICDLESERDFANSGAPVKIENVKQYPASQSSIEVQFDIVHTPTEDSGSIYKSGVLDSSCKVNGNSPSSTDASIEEDHVSFDVNAAPLNNIRCNGGGSSGQVQLNEDKATVYCTIDTTGEEEYVKPATITLNYDYLESISQDILIEHVSR